MFPGTVAAQTEPPPTASVLGLPSSGTVSSTCREARSTRTTAPALGPGGEVGLAAAPIAGGESAREARETDESRVSSKTPAAELRAVEPLEPPVPSLIPATTLAATAATANAAAMAR